MDVPYVIIQVPAHQFRIQNLLSWSLGEAGGGADEDNQSKHYL